ncbi:MAG TPA: transglutaminase family protein [Anaeromyxobacter sp.]
MRPRWGPFEAALAAQDATLARRGLAIWIGGEPTFTDARSQEPWWLSEADGGDKLSRARAMLRALAARLPGRVTLARLAGRQYTGEPTPRFCLGALMDGTAGPGDGPPDEAALDGAPAPAPVPRDGEALFTVTPDPGVVEVNMAPAPDLATYLAWSEAIHAAAAEVGLSAVRHRYDGQATDSGGGGQLTLGGPTPEASPFFAHPQLLPRLVRYLENHPALSYAFAGECVGSASQGPRPDEGVRERYEELEVALDRLEDRGAHLAPGELWEILAPVLVDAAGNSHRAELNVEKLWNPSPPGRGRMGVVELRALRMQPDARRQAAVAALFRAVAARLVAFPYREPLADWGGALHDQLALPAFLQEGLATVLRDLDASGLGLGAGVEAVLLDPPEPLARVELGGATLTVTPALEFWPLVGDVASQERSGARLVDSSSRRVELLVSHPHGLDAGQLSANGWRVPLQRAGDRRQLAAVRWRAFAPSPGLHRGLPPTDPLVLRWELGGERIGVELHGWIPDGGSYDGLPADAAEAARRRNERVRLVRPTASAAPPREPPAPKGFTLDLRRLDAIASAAHARAGGTT